MRYLSAAFGFVLMTVAPALAGPRQDMLAAIARCNTIADERQFLDCVYGAAQPVRAELGLPPASPAQQRLVPVIGTPAAPVATVPAAAPAHDGFSLFGGGLQMTAYSFDRRGMFTVTLGDGSVWKQNSNDTNQVHFGGKASNYTVSITTSDAGVSRMTVRGEGGPYLVARIR